MLFLLPVMSHFLVFNSKEFKYIAEQTAPHTQVSFAVAPVLSSTIPDMR